MTREFFEVVHDAQKHTSNRDEDFTKAPHKDKLDVNIAGPGGRAATQFKLFPAQGML